MKDKQIKQMEMCGAVSRFTTDHAAALDAVEGVGSEAADVRVAYAALQQAVANPVEQTKDVTALADDARKQLRRALPALLGPLTSLATKTKNVDLLARATLRARQLNKLSPTELNALADQLITLGESQPAATKTKYGLTAILPLLRGYQTDFEPLVGQTQDLIDTRAGANQSAKALLRATLQQVYELDKVMLVFQLLNPDLHRDYRRARRVGKRSGGGGGNDAPQA